MKRYRTCRGASRPPRAGHGARQAAHIRLWAPFWEWSARTAGAHVPCARSCPGPAALRPQPDSTTARSSGTDTDPARRSPSLPRCPMAPCAVVPAGSPARPRARKDRPPPGLRSSAGRRFSLWPGSSISRPITFTADSFVNCRFHGLRHLPTDRCPPRGATAPPPPRAPLCTRGPVAAAPAATSHPPAATATPPHPRSPAPRRPAPTHAATPQHEAAPATRPSPAARPKAPLTEYRPPPPSNPAWSGRNTVAVHIECHCGGSSPRGRNASPCPTDPVAECSRRPVPGSSDGVPSTVPVGPPTPWPVAPRASGWPKALPAAMDARLGNATFGRATPTAAESGVTGRKRLRKLRARPWVRRLSRSLVARRAPSSLFWTARNSPQPWRRAVSTLRAASSSTTAGGRRFA